jgi:hypothetical protein
VVQVDDDGDDEADDDDEVKSLTPELKKVFGKNTTFDTEESLYQFMNDNGIGDCRIVLLDGKPRLVMPTDQHNAFTSETVGDFMVLHGKKWGYATGTHNVHLSTNSRRKPDVSFFGYPRCVRNKRGVWVPYNKGAVPDVVIQFSWRNQKGYEEQAINDMMTKSLEIERGAPSQDLPRVGYLIKVRFAKKQTLPGATKGKETQSMTGLDIYQLPHGTTVDDAIHGNNGARKWDYYPNKGSDSEILISPEDLGIPMPSIWNGYRIQVSDLFNEMNDYHKMRQQDGLAI